MVSAFQLLWNRGKLVKCLLLLRCVKLLDIVVIFLLQEKGKRRCLGVQSSYRVNLRFPVLPSLLENKLYFTLTDVLVRANLLSETVLEGVLSSFELPLC